MMFKPWRRLALPFAAIVLVSLAACEGCAPKEKEGDPEDQACTAYCDAVMEGCTGDNRVFASADECLATCAGYPTTGADGDDAGDTLQCRAFHASAVADDPATHCAHASAQGGGVCGTQCDVYCRLMVGTCATFDDTATCLATCNAFPADGAWNTLEGNNVQCRTSHALFVAADNSHCAHAGITGGGVCGAEVCDAYCDQVMSHCGGAQALYPSRDACLSACGNMPEGGDWSATDGNSVQCRAYHGAGAAAADPATHCAHAAVNGGAVCGPYCDSYCDQVMSNCTGDNALFADRAACTTACGSFRVGSDFAIGGDSVQCRTYHGSFPAAEDPAMHCAHASVDGAGVCFDEAPPPQSVTLTGEVHELGGHLNNNHVGVGAASVAALGVSANLSTQTADSGTVGAYTLSNVPANGQIVLVTNKAGYHPTYQAVAVGSASLTQGLVLAEVAWMSTVASTYGVTLDAPFACQFDATLQCVYAMVLGQVLDDGTGASSAQPVAGIAANEFIVTGGDDNVAWRKMGPYFLNANGSANASNTITQGTGLYVVFVEIPQTAAGYDAVHIEIAISRGSGATAEYYGPTHTAAYRGGATAVTWADVRESGVPPDGGGGVSFDAQIYPLFLPIAQGGFGCQGCHTNQGGATPAGGLNLYGGADVAYASIEPSTHPAIIDLENPAQSLLLRNPLYQGPGGPQNHPISAWYSTQDAAYQLILQWIEEGALRVAAGQRVSFVAQIKPLLGNPTSAGGMGCISCHTGGAAASLQLDGNANEMYAELTTEAAVDGSGSGETTRINKGGYPERSLVLTSLLSGSSEAHPQKPFASSADPRYQLIYRWVTEGYENDGYCDTYCSAIQAQCTGTYQQYADIDDCLATCGAMPRGTPGDQANDTAECRLFHVSVAANNEHCAHAGPSGGGACGGWCDAYCRQTTGLCTQGDAQYANLTECLDLCNDMPTDGAVGALDGDTVQCRSAHVQFAGADASHCDHAGFDGADTCGGWCDVYCRNIQDYCTGGDAQFNNETDCQNACGGYSTSGAIGDLTGDTVQCRLTHLKYAEADTSHCAHAGEASAADACQ